MHAENGAQVSVVTFTLEELYESGDAQLQKVEQGFGASGLGVVTVSGIPGVLELRKKLLLSGDAFAALPEDIKQRYQDPLGGRAVVGWSCGIEAFEDGRPDLNKGSFYANPLHDSVAADGAAQETYPSYTTPNVWPSEELPELREAFREMGQLMIRVGTLLAQLCDCYIRSKNAEISPGALTRVISESPNPKGRLLHYFPPTDASKEGRNNWCAQHTDHGSLTGLLSALYTRDGVEVPNPDGAAGLYVRMRDGSAQKVAIAPSDIAFQMGEAMQVHSGGLLRATPHFVRTISGAGAVGIARNTFAVFMQPWWGEPMDIPPGSDPEAVRVGQWRPGITFGEFTELTVNGYLRPKPETRGNEIQPLAKP